MSRYNKRWRSFKTRVFTLTDSSFVHSNAKYIVYHNTIPYFQDITKKKYIRWRSFKNQRVLSLLTPLFRANTFAHLSLFLNQSSTSKANLPRDSAELLIRHTHTTALASSSIFNSKMMKLGAKQRTTPRRVFLLFSMFWSQWVSLIKS